MSRDISLPPEVLNQIIGFIVSTVPTNSIYIFGSYARREETEESDIDIYVVTDKPGSDRIDYEAMADVGMALRWMNQPKDILCLSKEEFVRRSARNTGPERVIVKEGVKIYGR